MNKTEKNILIVSIVFLVFLFGAVMYSVNGAQIQLPGCVTDVKPFEKGELKKLEDGRYQLFVVAKMWTFDPFKIEVPAGSVVDIYITSADVVHGFNIPEKDVNVMAIPGVIGYRQVKFDKPGEYDIICHEFCGVGHQNMFTKLVVK